MNEYKLKKNLTYTRNLLDGVEIKYCCGRWQSLKKHVHNELSIGFIEDGETDVILDKKKYNFRAGDGVIIPPLMSHSCMPYSLENWKFTMIYINTEYYNPYIKFLGAFKLPVNLEKKVIKFINLVNLTKDKELLESILINLLLDLEYMSHSGLYDENFSNSSKIAIKAREYIINNFNSYINLGILEKNLGINRFSIIRSFKKNYNTTPISFQLQLRTAQAKKMLSLSEDVFEICDIFKFCDQSHFIREFKKMYGVTPFTYLESIRK